jgi:hypothetical protein
MTQTCSCGEKHVGHICVLKGKGLMDQVRHLTDSPTVVCFTCGTEANSADNVCAPMPLDK